MKRDYDDELTPGEKFWRGNQPYLLSCGYQLRPRYRPGWSPSWILPTGGPVDHPMLCEDYWSLHKDNLIDAIHLEDGRGVMLKRLQPHLYGTSEKEIALFLSSGSLRKHPANHCVPILDVLKVPNDPCEVLVMPLLRVFDDPRYDTIGEIVDFFWQTFTGLQLIHQNHIAHRDNCWTNIMMDASELYPEGYHPRYPDRNPQSTGPARQRYTRTQRPPKYYWIDFGLSRRYDEKDDSPSALPVLGGDRTVPEFRASEFREKLYDPFPTDIYYLGNLVRSRFLDGDEAFYHQRTMGLDFMRPLIEDMTQDDPLRRPTIDQAVDRLRQIIRCLRTSTLRSPVRRPKDNVFGNIRRFFPYWTRRIFFVVRRIPPIPVRQGTVGPV